MLHQKRSQELSKISALYNKPLYKVGVNKVLSLVEFFEKEKPEIICVPFFFDWHPEHIEVMNILKQALLKIDCSVNIAMYQVSIPIPRNCITHVYAMTKTEWNEKWNLFKSIYKSQLGIPYKRFAINEHITGAICNSYAGEAFVFCSSSVWLLNYQNWLLNTEEIKEVSKNLQSIKNINKLVECYSKKRIWKNIR